MGEEGTLVSSERQNADCCIFTTAIIVVVVVVSESSSTEGKITNVIKSWETVTEDDGTHSKDPPPRET
jgi:hypothetical protein